MPRRHAAGTSNTEDLMGSWMPPPLVPRGTLAHTPAHAPRHHRHAATHAAGAASAGTAGAVPRGVPLLPQSGEVHGALWGVAGLVTVGCLLGTVGAAGAAAEPDLHGAEADSRSRIAWLLAVQAGALAAAAIVGALFLAAWLLGAGRGDVTTYYHWFVTHGGVAGGPTPSTRLLGAAAGTGAAAAVLGLISAAWGAATTAAPRPRYGVAAGASALGTVAGGLLLAAVGTAAAAGRTHAYMTPPSAGAAGLEGW